jgi:hypothetical protein
VRANIQAIICSAGIRTRKIGTVSTPGLSVPIPAPRRARHFALVTDVPIQLKLARNRFSGLEHSPTHPSGALGSVRFRRVKTAPMLK